MNFAEAIYKVGMESPGKESSLNPYQSALNNINKSVRDIIGRSTADLQRLTACDRPRLAMALVWSTGLRRHITTAKLSRLDVAIEEIMEELHAIEANQIVQSKIPKPLTASLSRLWSI